MPPTPAFKWSPEQIAGVGKIIGHKVSHEWIYGYVQRDKLTGGKLYKKLRHGRRKYRKGSHAKLCVTAFDAKRALSFAYISSVTKMNFNKDETLRKEAFNKKKF